jgi:hypothetical protein
MNRTSANFAPGSPIRRSRTAIETMKSVSASLVLLLLSGFLAKAASPLAMEIDPARAELAIRFQDRTLLVYAYATNQFKPYVRALYTLLGENVLRDAPRDHLHHHGLMYAISVSGTNFWEEQIAPGTEKPIKLLAHKTGKNANGLPQAQFTQLIHWLAPTNKMAADSAAAALLLEHRTLTLTVDEKNEEVALRWQSAFQVGKNAGNVTLHGSAYQGLGLRLPQSFDHVAKFQNAADLPYTNSNSQNVVPAQWTTVAGVIDGRDIMLALFGDPRLPPADAAFFSMLDRFAYLSATQSLDKKPLEYSGGDKFTLDYLVAVYSAHKPRDFVQQRYDRWKQRSQ